MRTGVGDEGGDGSSGTRLSGFDVLGSDHTAFLQGEAKGA